MAEFPVDVSDTVVVSDVAANAADYLRQPSDTSVLTDGVVLTSAFQRTLQDADNVTDAVVRSASYAVALSATVSVTDTGAREMSFLRLGTDSAILTDQAVRSATWLTVATDTATLSDQTVATKIVPVISFLAGSASITIATLDLVRATPVVLPPRALVPQQRIIVQAPATPHSTLSTGPARTAAAPAAVRVRR